MPQLETTWYISQLFWVLTSFCLLYVIVRCFILPTTLKIMDDRQQQINNDLKAAQDLKEEAQKAIKSYELSIAGAHDKASEILKQTREDIMAFTKEEETRFSQKIKQRSDEAKGKIDAAHEKVMVEMEGIASDLVGKIVYKMIAENINSETIKSSVSKAVKEAS